MPAWGLNGCVRNTKGGQSVLGSGDTLVRELDRGLYSFEILRETSYLHNKKNGIEITYYPNGIVGSIDYYVDGKLWDVISRSDSTGRLINPGTVHNGSGVLPLYSVYGFDSLGRETYKDGYPDGMFAYKNGGYIAEGDLIYKQSAVNFTPGKRVTYTNSGGEVDSGFFSDREYAALFLDSQKRYDLRELNSKRDSALEDERGMLYISGIPGFGDPAVIPKGVWTVRDSKTKKIVEKVVHDDNGNPIEVTKYKENGDILWSKKFSPCGKRKEIRVVQ